MDRFFKFDGYAQRSEYWAVMVILIFGGFLLGFGFAPLLLAEELAVLGVLVFIALFVIAAWLSLATTARRCRDAGISPYWCLVTLLPYAGLIGSIVFGVIPTAPRDAEVFE